MARRTARKSTMPPPARPCRSRELVLRQGPRKGKAERIAPPHLRSGLAIRSVVGERQRAHLQATMEEDMADTLSQLSRQLSSTIEAASKAVVAVHGRGRLASSGIIWEPGLVVTAEETVERDTDLAVTLPDGRRVEATLAGRDPSTDIAALRFGGEAPAIAAAVASELRPGHLAVAVGRSQGDVIAALGIVSLAGGAWHSSHGGKIDAKLRFDLRLTITAEG